MSAMSTPISNLPKSDSNPPSTTNIDASVTDVLEEMEREVAAAQKSSPPPPPAPAPPMMVSTSSLQPSQMMPAMNMNMNFPMQSLPLYMKENVTWVDTPKMKTAAVAAILAAFMLLPKLPNIYDRFSRISFLEPYELYIRIGMLALVLYLVMVRLEL